MSSNTRLFSSDDEQRDDFVCDESSSYYPILKDLNPSQIRAVTQPLISVTRVVAGPGSGKTRVLTSRIAFLLQEDVRSNVLALTFTRKAANEMKDRLERLLQFSEEPNTSSNPEFQSLNEYYDDNAVQSRLTSGLQHVSVGTFHSICVRILRANGNALQLLPSVVSDMERSHNQTYLDRNFNIVDQSEQIRVIKQCLSDHDIDLKKNDLKPMDILNGVTAAKQEIFRGKNPFGEEKSRVKSLREKIALKMYYPYREKLLASNCIDFDDIIYFTRELLMEKPSVREQCRKKWKHILVDEFQDTSQVQLDLVKLLTSSSLLVVGDADQSIYSWRGAHAGSMSDFATDFREYHPDGVTTVYLMENYRSTENIVKAAQKVISNSNDSSQNHLTRQKMIPKRSKGPPPRIVSFLDSQSEAEFVVTQVKQTIDMRDKDHSIACIYRTNAQSRAIEEACVKHNVPYILYGSATSFYKRQEIKDCLCFLRWLHNERDRSSMLRCFSTPKKGIGDSALGEFDQYCALVETHWAENLPGIPSPTPLEILLRISGDYSWGKWKDSDFPPLSIAFTGRSLKPLTTFSQQMQKIRAVALVDNVETLLSALIDEMELLPHFDKISKSKSEFEERQENVLELRRASQKYSNMGPCFAHATPAEDSNWLLESPLGNFLDDVTLVTDMVDIADSPSEERFVIKLMTIHGSKGLEFDTVYLLGMEDGTLPTSQALNEGMGSVTFEEERRLCYVAMTRAKTELVLTWRREVPMFCKDGIKVVDRKRSRFLDVLVEPNNRGKSDSLPKPNQLLSALGPSSPGLISKNDSQHHLAYQTARPDHRKNAKNYINNFKGTAAVYSNQKHQLPGALIAKTTGRNRDALLSRQPTIRDDFYSKTTRYSEEIHRQLPLKERPMIKQLPNFTRTAKVSSNQKHQLPGSLIANKARKSSDKFVSGEADSRSNSFSKESSYSEKISRKPTLENSPIVQQVQPAQTKPRKQAGETGSFPFDESP